MYCVYCGNQIPDDSDFCTHCGKPLTQQSTNTTVKSKSRRVPKIVKIIAIIVVICLFIGITANVIGRMVLHSQLSHTWITYSTETPAFSMTLQFLDREVICSMRIFGSNRDVSTYPYRTISHNKVIIGETDLVFNVMFFNDNSMYLYSEDTDLWQEYIWVIDD